MIRRLLGTVLPYIGRVIVPCDAAGAPVDGEAADYTPFETGAVVFAWLGRYAAFAFGDVMTRRLDPSDPTRFAPGDWAT